MQSCLLGRIYQTNGVMDRHQSGERKQARLQQRRITTLVPLQRHRRKGNVINRHGDTYWLREQVSRITQRVKRTPSDRVSLMN